MSDLEVREVRDLPGLEGLREPWGALVGRAEAASPFLAPAFLLPWVRLTGAMYAPRVLTAWRDGTLVGLAPLFDRRVGPPGLGVVRRSFPIFGMSPPFDWLVAEDGDAVTDAFVAALAAAPCELVELLNVPAASPLRERLARAAGPAGLRLRAGPGKQSTLVRMQPDFDTWLKTLSKNLRRTRRKALNRLRRQGGFAHLSLADLGLDEARAQCMSVIARSWKRFSESDADWPAFFDELIAGLAAEGWLEIHVLRQGDEPIASILEIDHRGVAHGFHIAYDLAHQDASPGALILQEAIRCAHEKGLSAYDLGGDLRYLERHANDVREHETLWLERRGLLRAVRATLYRRAKAWQARRLDRQTFAAREAHKRAVRSPDEDATDRD